MEGGERETRIFRDIRRYYCEYCGISRSKKALLTSHILSNHQEEIKEREADEMKSEESNTCGECGATFSKPAYLKQHMQSHSLERNCSVKHWIPHKELQYAKCLIGLVAGWGTSCEAPSSELESRSYGLRPFTCLVDDCNSSYRRKDHLTRHLLQHEGKLHMCPIETCNCTFAFQGNMKRHVKQFHEASRPVESNGQKQHICQEIGCGKVFKYASKLRKHEESHVQLDSVEAVCSEPGCFKYFSNAKCLKAHLQTCHQHVTCAVCGTKHLKKNLKQHMRTHEAKETTERIKCEFEGCVHTFSNKSNLRQHMKAVHLEVRPFVCGMPDCGMRFSYKNVRDKHEKTARHVHTEGDFEEFDALFRSRPRGGRKRTCPPVESLLRKRAMPPDLSDYALGNAPDYLSWLLSRDGQS